MEQDPKKRQQFIGGSDAAAVLGISRWRTRLEVWAEKTGRVIPEPLDGEAVELGVELEDYVARRFTKKTGKDVRRVNRTLYHDKYPFIAAHIDRGVSGEDAILECKTTGAYMAKQWEGEDIPREYLAQCHHYLAVTGQDRCYVAVLIGNQEFRWKCIERDERIIQDIVKAEADFWNDFVVPNVLPFTVTKDDSDILYQVFSEVSLGMDVALPDDVNILIEQIQSMSQDIISLEGQVDKNKNTIKAMLKDAELGHTGLWKVSWKEQITNRLDTKLVKEEKPEIYHQYCNQTKSRVLRYKKAGSEKGV